MITYNVTLLNVKELSYLDRTDIGNIEDIEELLISKKNSTGKREYNDTVDCSRQYVEDVEETEEHNRRRMKHSVELKIENENKLSSEKVYKDEENRTLDDALIPLIQYKKKGRISVTELSSQLWCEQQVEFVYTVNKGQRTQTKRMEEGSEVHGNLEAEDHLVELIEVSSIEDLIGVKLYNSLMLFKKLLLTGRAREIWLFTIYSASDIDMPQADAAIGKCDQGIDSKSFVGNIIIRGIIDELRLEKKSKFLSQKHPDHGDHCIDEYKMEQQEMKLIMEEDEDIFLKTIRERRKEKLILDEVVIISDTKTRKVPKAASPAQEQSTALQLQSYFYMLNRLIRNSQSGNLELYDQLLDAYGCNKQRKFDTPVLHKYKNLTCLINKLSNFIALLPPVHEDLEVIYEHAGRELCRHYIPYCQSYLNYIYRHLFAYWLGHREAEVVDPHEKFKCKSCEFLHLCKRSPLDAATKELIFMNHQKDFDTVSKLCTENSQSPSYSSQPPEESLKAFTSHELCSGISISESYTISSTDITTTSAVFSVDRYNLEKKSDFTFSNDNHCQYMDIPQLDDAGNMAKSNDNKIEIRTGKNSMVITKKGNNKNRSMKRGDRGSKSSRRNRSNSFINSHEFPTSILPKNELDMPFPSLKNRYSSLSSSSEVIDSSSSFLTSSIYSSTHDYYSIRGASYNDASISIPSSEVQKIDRILKCDITHTKKTRKVTKQLKITELFKLGK